MQGRGWLAAALLGGALAAWSDGPAGAADWTAAADPIGALIGSLEKPGAVQLAEQPSFSALWPIPELVAQAPDASPPPSDAEYRALYQQLLADPQNLDLMFRYARAATARGDYDQAIATYERMLIINPNLPRIRLELGALYFRVGAYPVARQYFLQVMSDQDVPPEVRQRIDRYLAEIGERSARSRLFGSIFLGAQYQTNPTSSPGEGTVVPLQIFPGFIVPATLRNANDEDDVNGLLTANLRHYYAFNSTIVPTLETNFFGSGALYADQDELNSVFLGANTGPSIQVLPNLFPETSLRPFVSAQYAFLDEDTYFWAYGGGVELRREFTDRLYGQLSFEHLERDFNATEERPFNDERDADIDTLEGQARIQLDPMNRVDLVAYGLLNDAEVGWESYDEVGGRATLSHQMPSPFADLPAPWNRLDQPWVLSAAVAGRLVDYDDPDPVIAPETTREDREWRLIGTSRIGLTRSLSALLQVEYRNVDSNIALYEFDNVAVTVGALWRFP